MRDAGSLRTEFEGEKREFRGKMLGNARKGPWIVCLGLFRVGFWRIFGVLALAGIALLAGTRTSA